MNGEEIKKTKVFDLVKRLYVIDAKLNGETRELVCEYNEIIEELWNILGEVESKVPLSKRLVRKNGGRE